MLNIILGLSNVMHNLIDSQEKEKATNNVNKSHLNSSRLVSSLLCHVKSTFPFFSFPFLSFPFGLAFSSGDLVADRLSPSSLLPPFLDRLLSSLRFSFVLFSKKRLASSSQRLSHRWDMRYILNNNIRCRSCMLSGLMHAGSYLASHLS